ncbi:hypothetical protein DMENIID0001_137950 [Sergentomyia squamirostris]
MNNFHLIFFLLLIFKPNIQSQDSGDSGPPKARPKVSFVKISPQVKSNFILGHNGLRNRVALRKDKPASNMNLIAWDLQMEMKAKSWIVSCYGSMSPPNYCQVPQLPGINRLHIDQLRTGWEFSTIRLWFHYYRVTLDSDLDSLKRPTTYTQIIWASVRWFGCALAQIDETYYVVACSYQPSGNIPRMAVYKTGDPCSHCEDIEACSVTFSGLCGIDKSRASVKSFTLMLSVALAVTIF